MDFEVSYNLENEQQFWDELEEIISAQCDSEDLIDNALRAYLSFTTKYKDQYLTTEYDVSRCSYQLLSSNLFAAHADYVRRQIIYSLLQEDDPSPLHLIASLLLFDGRQHEDTFYQMNDDGTFPRLLELIHAQRKVSDDDRDDLVRVFMDLLYEMSRIQRVRTEDLVLVDDDFIKCLFEMVEEVSYDANDPYHYPVIRVLLVLNEQFMISAHNEVEERAPPDPLTNRVIKVLSMHGNTYKVFGENIILLINREGETSLQLLTLKLLYLIFTTPSTYEYFYTNDLRVLLDILIRNLLDLPEEAVALRHTYLRVLYPLLAHTQLKYPPYYKRDELKRVLRIIARDEPSAGQTESERILHFDDADDTTKRLVARCVTVGWLRDTEPEVILKEPIKEEQAASTSAADVGATQSSDHELGNPLQLARTMSSSLTLPTLSPTPSTAMPDSPTELRSDAKLKSAPDQSLGMHLDAAADSALSVREVAVQHERPGVITPSRNDSIKESDPDSPSKSTTASSEGRSRIKPEPPKARRWRGRHTREEVEQLDKIMQGVVTITTQASAHGSADRRNSAGASLAPPVPAHLRRSASNPPPPAVPPPRRSSHSTQQPQLALGTGSASPTASPTSPQRHGQKPEPPKTRRWGRGKHPQTGSADGKLDEARMSSSAIEEDESSETRKLSEVEQGEGLGLNVTRDDT